MRERERESVCMYMCVCVRVREREKEEMMIALRQSRKDFVSHSRALAAVAIIPEAPQNVPLTV